MTDERFKTASCALGIITREKKDEKEVLLQKRKNTGYMDGFWDLSVVGHIEKDKSATSTIIDELRQELGVSAKRDDLEFAQCAYNNYNGTIYSYFYFLVKKFDGKIELKEPEKCEELKWFEITNLPPGMIPDREESLKQYLINEKKFCEFGWE